MEQNLTSSPAIGNTMLPAVDSKVKELLKITDEFIFPAYYAHEDAIMWKISNVYTQYNSETLVLCRLDEGIEHALDLAIEHIGKRRKDFYGC